MLNLLHKKCKLGGVRTWSNAKKCKRNLWRLPNSSIIKSDNEIGKVNDKKKYDLEIW